jgi:hypothetical protein
VGWVGGAAAANVGGTSDACALIAATLPNPSSPRAAVASSATAVLRCTETSRERGLTALAKFDS